MARDLDLGLPLWFDRDSQYMDGWRNLQDDVMGCDEKVRGMEMLTNGFFGLFFFGSFFILCI